MDEAKEIERIELARRMRERIVDEHDAVRLLPAWFTTRMLHDVWQFGLMLKNGNMLAIQSIEAVNQDATGRLWLDVRLLPYADIVGWFEGIEKRWGIKVLGGPTSREHATVAADQVVLALELADT